MNIENPWNELADVFGSKYDDEKIAAGLADNIMIAWPSIIGGIQKHFGTTSGLMVLDFGCGGGHFCRELARLDNQVTGYDTSEKLIDAARRNVPRQVSITESKSVLKIPSNYDVISAIMVFQFIRDIDSVIGQLLDTLKPGGLLIYAVFNPSFVFSNTQSGLFKGVCKDSIVGIMELRTDLEIPTYIRTSEDYCRILSAWGCEEVYRDCPPFSKEYLAKYNVSFSTDEPEFLIQAFKRI